MNYSFIKIVFFVSRLEVRFVAIRINDLLNLNKLYKQFMLVEAPQAYTKFANDENTGGIEDYKYSIVLPDFLFEKIEVKVEQDKPSISQVVVEKEKSIAEN